MVKMASFLIPIVKFEFKCATWTNQKAPHSYSPLALVAGSTDRAGPSVATTIRPGQSLGLQAAGPISSIALAITDHQAVAPPVGTSFKECKD
jgi:hypothetical protein